MRIFYASHDQGNHQPDSLTWYNNLYLPLCQIAEEVTRFDFDLFETSLRQDPARPGNAEFIKQNKPALEKALLSQLESVHKDKPIDIFFSYFANAYCGPEVIKEIRRWGIKTVNWFCNASYQFQLVNEIAPAYDFCLVPEKYRLEDYKKAGANPIYCQEAANPDIYRPVAIARDIDVSFVGARYADRPAYVRALYNSGIDIKVWGERWNAQPKTDKAKDFLRKLYNVVRKDKPVPQSQFGKPLSETKMIETFSRSKINLGFSVCGSSHKEKKTLRQVRLRDFEVPMSGGFYLTEYNEELKDFFEEDKEVVFFWDAKECIEKAKYFLNHSAEREAIAKAGRVRALEDHTWQKRLKQVFTEMNFNKKQ